MPYIYKITNQLNGKSYIGKTMKTIQERWKEHCYDYLKEREDKRPLYNAMKKYGIAAFVIEEIEECSDKILSDRERYWIEYYGTFKNGYNATLGGDGKPFIDYDLVVLNYSIIQNCTEVAQLMGISQDSVSTILKLRNISVKSAEQVNRDKLGKPVFMYDKNNNFLQSFASRRDAAKWLQENNLTNCKLSTVAAHIGEVCTNKRKSAAGFIWRNP